MASQGEVASIDTGYLQVQTTTDSRAEAMELARDASLACEFGSSSQAGRPLLRVVAHVRTATRRWIAAEPGSYLEGENDLADRLAWSFRPGMLNLADRGFFSMDRFTRWKPSS